VSIVSEFKEFAAKGNVVDLAVGVVIGGAFGKIVGSFVNDVLMPPIGILLGGMDFKSISLTLKAAVMEGDKVLTPAVTMNVGNFIQTVVDFLIIAFAIFIMVKGINKMKRKQEEAPAAPPEPSDEVKLLTEIRDSLRK
jgi:large conductance mechanosensitive channel